MKKTKHTPEPWAWENYEEMIHVFPDNKGGSPSICKMIGPNRESNARRIVACVNACAGIDTKRLEENAIDPIAGLFGRMAARLEIQNRALTAQRDELLAALKETRAKIEELSSSDNCWFIDSPERGGFDCEKLDALIKRIDHA